MLCIYRFIVLYGGLPLEVPCCEIVCRRGVGSGLELWVRCGELADALNLLRELASRGVVHGIIGLDGRIYRTLPSRLEDFESLARFSQVFMPGSRLLVASCTGNVVEAAVKLVEYSETTKITRNKKAVLIKLAKPLTIEHLFDNGLRILKPKTRIKQSDK